MSWFTQLFVKKKSNLHQFTDEERENSIVKRNLLKQQRAMQRQQEELMLQQQLDMQQRQMELMIKQQELLIAEREQQLNLSRGFDEEDEEDEEELDEADELFLSIASKVMGAESTPQGIPQEQVSKVNMTDKELKKQLSKMSKTQIKHLKKMDDISIRKLATAQFPELSQETIERAIPIIRSL